MKIYSNKGEKSTSKENKKYNSKRQIQKYWRKDTETGPNNTDKTGHSKTMKKIL